MTEESAKQMTWHKEGVQYKPWTMVHSSDAEAEARNVRVALAIDGFNPYGLLAAP